MNVSLLTPTSDLQEEYLDFYNEWKDSGETMIPWVISKNPANFPAMVQELLDAHNGINIPETWVPDSTYWLVTNNNRIVGAVNIRHSLTEHLFNAGGHIGYGIRPSERRKGYATKLLALSLEKTILHNGGLRDDDFTEEDGNVVRRYWIEL